MVCSFGNLTQGFDGKFLIMLLSFSHPSPTEVRAETAVADSLIPSLILADEPISALDPIVAVQIVNELKSLREKYNTAIILVTIQIVSQKAKKLKRKIIREKTIPKAFIQGKRMMC